MPMIGLPCPRNHSSGKVRKLILGDSFKTCREEGEKLYQLMFPNICGVQSKCFFQIACCQYVNRGYGIIHKGTHEVNGSLMRASETLCMVFINLHITKYVQCFMLLVL